MKSVQFYRVFSSRTGQKAEKGETPFPQGHCQGQLDHHHSENRGLGWDKWNGSLGEAREQWELQQSTLLWASMSALVSLPLPFLEGINNHHLWAQAAVSPESWCWNCSNQGLPILPLPWETASPSSGQGTCWELVAHPREWMRWLWGAIRTSGGSWGLQCSLSWHKWGEMPPVTFQGLMHTEHSVYGQSLHLYP